MVPEPEAEPLSYEALRRVERAEGRSSKLTKLASDFWASLGGHLNALRARFAQEQAKDPSSREALFLADEIRSTSRLAESIGEVRERKVAQAALLALRTGKTTERPMNSLPEEGTLFDDLVRVLNAWRGRLGKAEPRSAAAPAAAAANAKTETKASPPSVDLALVRALDDIPSFVAPDDSQSYEFKRGEVGTIPRKAAEILAKRRKVSLLAAT